MRKTTMIIAGVLLAVSVLAGCGSSGNKTATSSGDKSYCDLIKSAKDEIKTFTGNSVPTDAQLNSFVQAAHDLAAKAPSEVSGDWQTVLDGLKTLTDALSAAGIKLDDFAKAVAAGTPPAGMNSAQMMQLVTKLQSLSTSKFQDATKAIDDNAKSKCGVTLTMAG